MEMTKKERFLALCKEIKRDGIDELINWLETETDFFTAPASTKYHGAHEGGLVEHSLNVYDRLIQQVNTLGFERPRETLIIISLFHDICKAGCYKKDFRNVKGEDGVWKKVPCYTFEEKFPFGGHGSKSVYLLSKFISLTDEEAVAINCHMGAQGDFSIMPAYERFPLAFAVHAADMYATIIDEA